MGETQAAGPTGVAGPSVSFTEDELARLLELSRTTRTPWWRDYTMLIAGAGFALSLATGMISAYVGHQKDVHDQQAQLADTLQRIQELTLRQAEVYDKYKGTAFEAPSANMITAEINTAVRTATELALRLGSNATTAELTTIAQGQYGVGDAATTQRLLKAALAAAQNANDESIALRYLGYFDIHSGGTPDARREGEALYARALELDTKYDLQAFPYSQHFLKATASFDWASAIALYDCPGAQAHYADGITNLLANPRTPEMDQMRRMARGAYVNGIGAVIACKPPDQPELPP
jgi:hypothetical protein